MREQTYSQEIEIQMW